MLTNVENIAEFGVLASAAKVIDYIPANSDKLIAHIKTLGGERLKHLNLKHQLPGLTILFAVSRDITR